MRFHSDEKQILARAPMGKWCVFEGAEATGKTSAQLATHARMGRYPVGWMTHSEPTRFGSSGPPKACVGPGDALRNIMQSKPWTQITPTENAQCLDFALRDRHMSMARVVEELGKGNSVLQSRTYISTVVLQVWLLEAHALYEKFGYGHGIVEPRLRARCALERQLLNKCERLLHAQMSLFGVPDVMFYFDHPEMDPCELAEVLSDRIGERDESLVRADRARLTLVIEGYRHVMPMFERIAAKLYEVKLVPLKSRVVGVDCLASKREIVEQIEQVCVGLCVH